MQKTIHPFFWLYLPIVWIILQTGFELSFSHEQLVKMHTEGGLVELLQSVPLAVAFLLAVYGLCRVDWAKQKLLGFWFAAAAICTFYVSGEEISWGQHIFYWDTPEYWVGVNDQQETNLHNTSAWFDQKPRLILFIAIVTGGLLVPFLRRYRPSLLPAQFSVLYPSNLLIPSALGVFLPYSAQKICDVAGLGVSLFERVSEVQELYMYYFVALYLWELVDREIPKKKA